MQQTQNYNLKLIETSDPFSPDALNENAETLAAELARVDAAMAAQTAAIAKLGNCQVVIGSYTGTGGAGYSNQNTLTFDHKPVLLCLQGGFVLVRPATSSYFGTTTMSAVWGGKSVSWYSPYTDIMQDNVKGCKYNYVALLMLE